MFDSFSIDPEHVKLAKRMVREKLHIGENSKITFSILNHQIKSRNSDIRLKFCKKRNTSQCVQDLKLEFSFDRRKTDLVEKTFNFVSFYPQNWLALANALIEDNLVAVVEVTKLSKTQFDIEKVAQSKDTVEILNIDRELNIFARVEELSISENNRIIFSILNHTQGKGKYSISVDFCLEKQPTTCIKSAAQNVIFSTSETGLTTSNIEFSNLTTESWSQLAEKSIQNKIVAVINVREMYSKWVDSGRIVAKVILDLENSDTLEVLNHDDQLVINAQLQ